MSGSESGYAKKVLPGGSVMKRELEIYTSLLKKYLETLDKKYLYRAEQLSHVFVDNEMLPEELVKLHQKAIYEVCDQVSPTLLRSLDFLLEAMIAYGSAHQSYQEMKKEQEELKMEIQIAANMQNTFLATTIPEIDNLEIGVTSVPYSQMNGDYYHFIKSENGALGVAIADVIGKGVPAALSMSMIKYSMDGIHEMSRKPQHILKSLNRVVERNVASNMFITMFYAQYNPQTTEFTYASAGHEPGFFYDAKTDTYREIKAEGLVLGVLDHTNYTQYSVWMEKDDMIILLTDGVTECVYGDRFITREEVLEVIKKYNHLHPQEQVDAVYHHFENLPEFELKDDFTLIILKKTV